MALEVYALSRTLPSVIHKGACGDQERDYFACIEHGESLGEAPRRWVLRLSVRRVWLDGGGLTLSSREPPMCRPTLSPLETTETTFRLLATGPQPLALNGHTIGLRRNSIGLWDLRGLLFHPATDVGVQRAALVELVGQARRHRGAWLVGLVGVLLPGLRKQFVSPADGRSGSMPNSGGMVLVSLLERLDDPDMSTEAAAESLLRMLIRPPAAPARPVRRRRLIAVPGGPR
jgi:hypothetical protein